MQSKILKVLTVIALSMCAVCSAAGVAYAEGSKELVENGGYRPYLEWNNLTNLGMDRENVIYVYAKVGETIYFGSSENAQNEASISAIGGTGTIDPTWYDGNETVGIAVTLPKENSETEAVDANGLEYVLYNNDISDRNKVYLFKVDKYENGTGAGYIKNVDQEKNGPNVGSVSDGYTPLTFTAPYTGTYSFRFLSSEHDTVNGKNVAAVKTDDAWNANGRAVAAFDITVYGGGGDSQTEQSGRVWADRLFLDTGSDKAGEGIYSKVYILTDDAFAYELDLNGMSPWGFVLYANKRGFLWDPEDIYTTSKKIGQITDETKFNLQSLNRSFYSKEDGTTDTGEPAKFNDGTIYPNYKPETDQDETHRLFFNNPSNSDALEFYTGHESLADSSSLPKVEKSVVSFKDGKTTNGNDNANNDGFGTAFVSSEGYGGTFTVNLNTSGLESYPETLALQLDFSEYSLIDKGDLHNLPEIKSDGTWKTLGVDESDTTAESSNIVTITASGHGGVYTFTWGGLDAYGNVVPRGDYSGIMKISVANGLVHIPLIDIETCENGIQVKMLNKDVKQEADIYTVYYNNTKISDLFNPSEAYKEYSIGDNKNMSDGISSKINTETDKSEALQFEYNAGDSTAIDLWTDYYTDVVNNLSIKVTPHATLYPIVSFVDQDGVQNSDTQLDNTHLWYNNGSNKKAPYVGKTGGEKYGNTISTGFMAEVQNIASYSVRNNILWTITIPNPATLDNRHGLYVKDVDGKDFTSKMFTNSADNKETVISDDPKAQILNGDIVKIKGFDENETKAVIRLYDNQGTVITGKGAVLYGIVIDGLYAPDATAEIMYVSGYEDVEGVQDLTENDAIETQVHAATYEQYMSSPYNPYHSSSDSTAAE